MQGLILAAGMGRRLRDLTENNTKCMIKVNGVTLISRVLHQLDKLGLSRIVIVKGYKGDILVNYISSLGDIQTPICYVDNPIYDRTNNIYSLSLAKEYMLEEDTLLLESDLIFEDDVLKVLLEDPRETLALVDKYESWMDGTCVKIGEDDSIEAFVPKSKFVFEDISSYYKTVNIYKLSKYFLETHYVPFLEAYIKALGENEYYEQVLGVIALLDDPEIKAKKLSGQSWYEIDDIQDLDIAESIFLSDSEAKVVSFQSRYGGYWRYPHMTDFCYLVNPYFPPQKLMNEIKANFEKLLTQYPSGLRVNSLLAAKNFGVHQEHILVGNGASELIKCLMDKTDGKVGFIRPTFEEYPNRYNVNESVVFVPKNENFSYSVQDLIEYFDKTEIRSLVLINPDNPTGNYIKKEDVISLVKWCVEREIRLVLDESFVDFSDETDSTLLDEEILRRYTNLVVMKSISKSYGVPGLRLGVMASSDSELISELKNDVAIWNINSFAEFYLQIADKYKKDYLASLCKIKEARKRFAEMLEEIPCLRVFPSQANYIMAELINGITAKELARKLLLNYNMLIKDLTGKIQREGKEYVRLAVRDDMDNERLVDALKEILN